MVRPCGMQRVVAFRSETSIRPFAACLALCAAAACSAGEGAEDAPEFTPFNPSGGGGPSTAAPPAGGQTGLGAGGSSNVPVTPEGNGGSLSLGGGGNTGVGTGSGGAPVAVGGNTGNTAGAGGSGVAGGGGSGNQPVPGTGPGRVGAELCPPGPFGNPLGNGVSVGAPLATINGVGFVILEGPVWTGDALYLSEIGNGNVSQIDRFTQAEGLVRGVFTNTGSNGLALDAEGNLLLAAHDVGGISRLSLDDGTITRGNQQRDGQRFNSPNDLVVRGDGNIYFTDPDFQSPSGRIQGGTNVYRIAPPLGAGEISVVEDDMDNPNGVTLSPDGNTLYVSGGGVLREYALDAAGAATPIGELSTNFQQPDGMAVDCAGNIYASRNGAQTVFVFSPDGEELGTIGPDGFAGQGVTNVAFGGPNRTTLFITTFSGNGQGGLFSVEVGVPGLPY
jgi:gluconolactonase